MQSAHRTNEDPLFTLRRRDLRRSPVVRLYEHADFQACISVSRSKFGCLNAAYGFLVAQSRICCSCMSSRRARSIVYIARASFTSSSKYGRVSDEANICHVRIAKDNTTVMFCYSCSSRSTASTMLLKNVSRVSIWSPNYCFPASDQGFRLQRSL